MGGIIGGGDDGGAAAAQLEEQRKQNEKMRAQAEAEKRDMLEKQQSGLKARQRGGARSLMSEARLGDEQGLKDTLGG
jgi:hypothetical protein